MLRPIIALLVLALGACCGDSTGAADGPLDFPEARDAAIRYVASHYPTVVLPYEWPGASLSECDWDEDPVECGTGGDRPVYQYASSDWRVVVGGPGDATSGFEVAVINPGLGFDWEGRVEAGGHVIEGPRRVLRACEATVELLDGRFPRLGFDELIWEAERGADRPGYETFAYTAEDWSLTVARPLLPDDTTCVIEVANRITGFRWEGELNGRQELVETAAYSVPPGFDES